MYNDSSCNSLSMMIFVYPSPFPAPQLLVRRPSTRLTWSRLACRTSEALLSGRSCTNTAWTASSKSSRTREYQDSIEVGIQCFRYYTWKGAPRPVCEWLVCKNADSCNSGLQYSSSSQVLWVSLASHNQLRDTLLVVEMYSSGCTSVHSTCTHSRLYIHSDYPSAHCKSKPAKANHSLFMANIYPIIIFNESNVNT